ncbi:camp-regulated phosphoprotein/endosulfine conserved region-domain-containing protein [Neurospora tetraspora]|uniref:mRNA stability protein n=1 Tax=Neurospora tetraspora TaxID=94610 RepID=A0AAE0MS35_9PEZI|nr:camp-regulated phosphoprotein/endosulfine conserved region-domain-containing protein [Neurospora tetraspora]
MNPHQAKKVDIQSLSPEEQRLFRLYGKLPSRSDHFAKHLKERKYFDSGDYAMSKAGKGDGVDTGSVGSQHPVPENIPHLTSPGGGINGASGLAQAHHVVHQHSNMGPQAGSPVKESSYLSRGLSAEELETLNSSEHNAGAGQQQQQEQAAADAISAAPANQQEPIPIRQ